MYCIVLYVFKGNWNSDRGWKYKYAWGYPTIRHITTLYTLHIQDMLYTQNNYNYINAICADPTENKTEYFNAKYFNAIYLECQRKKKKHGFLLHERDLNLIGSHSAENTCVQMSCIYFTANRLQFTKNGTQQRSRPYNWEHKGKATKLSF